MTDPEARLLLEALARQGMPLPPDAADRVRFARERIAHERGLTGTIERITWRVRPDDLDADRAACGGTLLLKRPRTGSDLERAAREVHFLLELAERVQAPAPTLLAAEVEPASDRVLLVLEPAPGHDGDAVAGCTREEVDAVLESLAPMQALAWRNPTLAAVPWLPTWGIGTAGRADPHRRRANRFRSRVDPFVERFGAAGVPELAALLRRIQPGLEALLAGGAALPTTLIHADLHLDNVRLGPPRVTVLDWQSISRGPLAYDLARFLGESLRGDDHAALDTLVAEHRRRLAALGVARQDLEHLGAELDAMLLRVVVGVVSGYGRRDPDAMPGRERAIVERTVGPGGLIDLVLRRGLSRA